MSPTERLRVVHASTEEMDATKAVRALREQLIGSGSESPRGVVFFCSSKYDLDALATAIETTFACPIAGCTTAGPIGNRGFQAAGITAAAIYSDELTLRTYLIQPLTHIQAATADVGEKVLSALSHRSARAFGLLLVDGLSMAEERLAASLHLALEGIPIVGGSAGDDLAFQATHVYHDGKFLRDAASLSIFETSLPFAPLKFQHFEPTETKLVITEAAPERRTVQSINGLPAAEAYGELIGVPVSELTSDVFSQHPLMLKVGGDYYVRAIQRLNPDLSLTFFCAIEEGLVLTLGRLRDLFDSASRAFTALDETMGAPQLVFGFDCILRRVELEHTGKIAPVGELYARHNIVGFSTYGEQYNGMHVSQTFTGVALGG